MTDYIRKKNTRPFFERSISITSFIDILIMLYTISIYIFSFGEENNISKLLALILMGMLAIYVLTMGKFVINKLIICLGLFTFFCFLSSLWAININYSISKGLTMIQIFILVFLLYNYLYYENKIDFLIKVICWSGIVFSVYTILYFGISEYFSGLEKGIRMGSEITNVNTIGMAAASAAVICLWYVFYNNKKIYLFSAIICTIVAFGSGSRKALFMLIMGVVFLFLLKGESKKKIISIFQCIGVILFLFLILQLPIFETINERVIGFLNIFTGKGEIESSANVRLDMIKVGWEQFLKAPFTGVGIGNSFYIVAEKLGKSVYMHNNYVELLSSVGIFGTGIFYCMYLSPIIDIIKLTLKQSKYAILALSLLIIELVLQYAAVQYYSKTTYLYLILFFLIADKSKNKEQVYAIKS